MTAPRLGLDPGRWDWLAAETTTIVHCAASVSFALPLEEARAVNVEGTRRMLELAGRAQALGGLERYAQVSTAYVAGTHAGRFSESDLDVGQDFNNSYEQSKFESEQLVRSRPELPFTIFRPSIVVGDRHSGWTAAFNVLYWPLRALARGLFPAVPAIASAPVDVVSVDYVADGIHELCESPGGIRQTYHLTAGADASTIAELAELASGYFQQPPPRLLSPAEFLSADHGVARSLIEEGAMYFPYFSRADHVRRRVHPRAARAGRDQRRAAERVHRPPARLRHLGPLGQAPDRAGRSAGCGLGVSLRSTSLGPVPPGVHAGRRARCPPPGGLSGPARCTRPGPRASS